MDVFSAVLLICMAAAWFVALFPNWKTPPWRF